MKYKALYNLLDEDADVALRLRDYPERIIVPTVGYLVFDEDYSPAWVEAKDREAFDNAIDRFLEHKDWYDVIYLRYNMLTEEVAMVPMRQFMSRDMAIGWTMASRNFQFIDLAKDVTVNIKVHDDY